MRTGRALPITSLRTVRLLNVTPIALAVLVACQGEARRRTDSLRSRNPAPAAIATSQVPKQATAHRSSLPLEAAAVCDTVAQRWRGVPSSTVEVRDTVANPLNRDLQHRQQPDELLA